VRPRGRSACLVAGDADGLTPSAGRRVHVLYCGPAREAAAAARRCLAAGLTFSAVEEGELPPPFRVPGLGGPSAADRSDRVRLALEHLHRERRFDLIEFPCRGGLGLRSVQAKRAGLAFDDVPLAVRLDACGPWLRDREHRWPAGPEELELDFAERYSFERADVRVTPCPDLLDYVRRAGWAVPADETSAPPPDDRPLVTVGIAHFNLGEYLPETLASLAAQTYPDLEVLVIDDGSTDPASVAAFAEMESRYPRFRFLRQPNAGIGATRNRALAEARGEYFVPVDADNVARPDMVERFVAAMRRNPDVSAMTCYFLAFRDTARLQRGEYAYAYRPAGGPHTLASLRNVYGDANAVFRTAAFREVGGYEADRGTSCEDWEAFVKLVHAGHRVEVIPEHLFFYRHRDAGFSRTTGVYPNHQRVLRQFFKLERLPPAERVLLWTALLGFARRGEELADRQRCLRYRVADRLHSLCSRVPFAARGLKRLLAGKRR
jgi:glycosyltransferase involved in cell wall biosynthesis